jgi:hypothetical protein
LKTEEGDSADDVVWTEHRDEEAEKVIEEVEQGRSWELKKKKKKECECNWPK